MSVPAPGETERCAAIRRDELPEQLRSRIGALSLSWPYEVTTTAVRAFARAAGYTDLVYYDRDAARAAGYRDLPAPPGFIGTPVYLPGYSDEVFSEPSFLQVEVGHSLEHLLDLGTETEYTRTLCAGDELTGTTSIADIARRAGPRTGEGLLVVRELVLIDDATGAPAALQRRYTLYCQALP